MDAVGTLHRFYGRSWSLQQRSLDAPQGAAQWAMEGKVWSLVERRQRRRRKGTSRLSELQRAPGEWTAATTKRSGAVCPVAASLIAHRAAIDLR